jgi:transcriptional antiterminator RfaH
MPHIADPACPSGKWLVINTHPHRETLALENLGRQSFHTYCPMIVKRVKHARKVQDVPRPLFPGYIFVAYAAGLSWRSILGTYGVKSVVRNGEAPGLLDGGYVEAMRAREKDGVIRKPASALKVGQEVAIQGGPLDGLVGKIIELRDRERVLLLLNLLDQETKTNIPSDMLNPL